jgi:hypothetical protein
MMFNPGIKRKHSDGREDKYIFLRQASKAKPATRSQQREGIVIMRPGEHN